MRRGIEKLLKSAKELEADKEKTCQRAMKQYELAELEAAKKVEHTGTRCRICTKV